MFKYTYEESVRWMRSQPDMADLVKYSYFDEDNLVAARRFAASEEFAAVAEILGLSDSRSQRKILDVGCGNGIASYAFASLGHEVFAVDPDPSPDVGLGATARLASALSRGSIETSQCFAESLPFPALTFDLIYARQSLHHFSELRKGLVGCTRVLKPGGLMLATREHVVDDERQLKLFLDGHPLQKMHGGEKAYPLHEYIAALEGSGLKLLKYFGPFDTVINYFPTSTEEIMQRFFRAMKRRLGGKAASVLVKSAAVERFYKSYISRSCKIPGRPYSFLCQK